MNINRQKYIKMAVDLTEHGINTHYYAEVKTILISLLGGCTTCDVPDFGKFNSTMQCYFADRLSERYSMYISN